MLATLALNVILMPRLSLIRLHLRFKRGLVRAIANVAVCEALLDKPSVNALDGQRPTDRGDVLPSYPSMALARRRSSPYRRDIPTYLSPVNI